MTTTTPTQILHPWIATLRTLLAIVAGSVVAIFGFITALTVFAPQFLAAIAAILPPEWLAWATAAVATLGAVSAAITRIMAIPGVNAWLTKIRLGAAGQHSE